MYCPACGHSNPPGSDACGNCMLDLSHLHEPALRDRVERSLMTDPVAALNPREPMTLPESADLGQAIALMIDRGVGAVLITDAAGRLVGILTERDFLSKVAGRADFAALPIRNFMTTNPETVVPTDTLGFAVGNNYPVVLNRHVFDSLAFHARINLHVRVLYGRDPHHICEAQYKAVARALRQAVEPDPRVHGIPSTKGVL